VGTGSLPLGSIQPLMQWVLALFPWGPSNLLCSGYWLSSPGVHPTSYAVGTGSLPLGSIQPLMQCVLGLFPWSPSNLLCSGYWVSSPGVKRPGCGVNHTPPSRAEVKERVELHSSSSSSERSRSVAGYILLFYKIKEGELDLLDITP
jgi:hypothetical protein